MTLDVLTDPRPDGVRIVVEGDLDITSAAALQRALAQASPYVGVLDLSGVGFLDSSGLAVVLDAVRDAQAAGRRLLVDPGQGAARRVLRLAGVLDELHLA